MIYKTLHWYIFKELLRIFLLAASALTTLLAFGGTFKPLTKAGLDAVQLMQIMLQLMPAMLAYSIPLAALFAAVQVYWRMSTDNEIVACRAGGISFGTIVMPALVLAVSISLTDFGFVNYIVPVFLQKAERLGRQDMGSLLTFNVSHQEWFKFGRLIVYADSAQLTHAPGNGPAHSIVVLNGLAATQFSHEGKPSAIVTARQAFVHFVDVPEKDEMQAWVQLIDGAAFHPVTLQKIGGTIDHLPPEGAYPIPSAMHARPKFSKLHDLNELAAHPDQNAEVGTLLAKMNQMYRCQQIARNYLVSITKPGQVVKFTTPTGERVDVHVPKAALSPERELGFLATPGQPVVVEQYRHDKLYATYRCDAAILRLNEEEYPVAHVAAALELHGTPVLRTDMILNIPETATAAVIMLRPLELDPALVIAPVNLDVPGIQQLSAGGDLSPNFASLVASLQIEVNALLREIASEKHCRGSFALSCLTLVMLGTALGILLRGRNPLAVFVVGFVPAIVLVLLITAGRHMVEWSDRNATEGYLVIWAGNVILVILVAAVYSRLLRH